MRRTESNQLASVVGASLSKLVVETPKAQVDFDMLERYNKQRELSKEKRRRFAEGIVRLEKLLRKEL